ncbi:putative transitional endoplasmic reticulum ATPase [Cardiosporidium cionae]|uniref:Transitional endoplasmic reticulum ATPase n=1 Tax=Cardiosporidium cionae TaxID=476202 RepID=A0ABQ7J8X8_9APIC|nr:putative transitional endoplasmic reticulum ATPase [Cardiosporidium cionae]|eukprot:KAF8820425.1 putative transitional endoplasmic reticulum ATPase [Cardiosporidium cionae]
MASPSTRVAITLQFVTLETTPFSTFEAYASAGGLSALNRRSGSYLICTILKSKSSLKEAEALNTENLTDAFSSLSLHPSENRSIVLQCRSSDEHPKKLKLNRNILAVHSVVLKSLEITGGKPYTVWIEPLSAWAPCREIHLQIVNDWEKESNQFGTSKKQTLQKKAARIPSAGWWEKLAHAKVQNYLLQCIHGCLLFRNNFIQISLHGIQTTLRVSTCLPVENISEDSPSDALPLKILCNTRVNLASFPVQLDDVTQDVSHNIHARIGMEKIGGLDEIIEEIKLYIILPLRFPEFFFRYGVRPPRGIILYGPPGSGKTFLVQAIVEELSKPAGKQEDTMESGASSLPHIELIQATDLISPITGMTESNIAAIFQRCKSFSSEENRSSLIFIDEIDAICPKREESSETGKRAVAVFLSCLDGIQSNGNFVVIGATNRPNSIDPALRRAGRLEREIEIGVPSSGDRLKILCILLEHIPHTLDYLQMQELSNMCQAFVGADLRTLISTAAFMALQGNMSLLSSMKMEDLVFSEIIAVSQEEKPKIEFKHFKMALKHVKPSGMKELIVEIPNVKWSDIGGYKYVKEKLKECVEWPYKFREAFNRLHLNPPRGILLYGPPGCSKTMMAKAVATESHMNFISIKGPEVFSKWVGESERTIRDLFRKARQNAPCVIFFDEIDALGGDRGLSDAGGVGSRVLSQMLNEMDGIGPLKEVVIIGATNRPDILDSALMRPGRFDRLIYVPLPDATARYEILFHQLKSMPIALDQLAIAVTCTSDPHESIADDKWKVFCEMLSRRTERYSGAEIVLLCREAAMHALRDTISMSQHNQTFGDFTSDTAEKMLAVSHASNDCAANVTGEHFEAAFRVVKPRIKEETLQFYEQYFAQEFERFK